jgi:cytidylate kinase
MIDDRQREMGLSRDNILVEARLSGWVLPEANLRIWLKASLECRVRRILMRDAYADIASALEETKAREASEALRYKKYYNIDIGSLEPYHMVLDTELWNVEQLGMIVCSAIQALSS